MTEEERKDYLKYIENYTINDLADMFNTQNFVIQDKDKFNEILLYYHFKQNEEIEQLQQENHELKELIDTILNWNIFKNECPMNFGYDEETNENKAQDLFYKDDDYCENNCNDDYKKCWLKYFKRMHELERVMVKSDSNE